jgi:hypothetical protein
MLTTVLYSRPNPSSVDPDKVAKSNLYEAKVGIIELSKKWETGLWFLSKYAHNYKQMTRSD